VAADAGAFARQVLIRLGHKAGSRKPDEKRLAEIRDEKKAWRDELRSWSSAPSKRMHPRRFLEELSAAVPKGSIVTTDVGNTCSMCNSYFGFQGPRQFLTALSWGNCGIAYGVGMGAKLGRPDTPVFALQRAEVLRGPQGTTFGRNATLGMMHLISARPSQEFSSSIDISAGELNLAGITGHVNGGLSDTVSGRVAFHKQYSDGAVENELTGDTLEYSDNMSLRGSLMIEPNDNFSAYIKAEYVNDEEFPTVRKGKEAGQPWLNANYGNYVNNADPWKASLAPEDPRNPWILNREMRFLTAELSWALDSDLAVTWISGFQSGDHHTNSDAFGTPYAIRDQEVWNSAEVFSQEVRIDNQASGERLGWLIGASYLKDKEHRVERNESEPLRGPCNAVDPLNCFRNSTLYTDAFNETEATGLFGEITYDVSDRMTLAVGGRYSTDSRDLDFSTYGYGAASGLGGIGLDNPDPSRDCSQPEAQPAPGQCGTPENPVGFDGVVSDSWSQFTPKISLSYAVNDNNTVYGLYSEGFKAGGFQQDARTASNLGVILDAEDATNIEFGWKGQYDNLIFALTVFQQEQTDVQTGNLVLVGSSQANLLVNAAGIENTGLEFEWTWAITDNFTFGGALASYTPEFAAGSQIAATFNAATGEFQNDGEDVSGRRPTGSVDEAATLWATYTWETANGGSWRIRADLRHRGDIWGQNSALDRAARSPYTGELYNLRPDLDKTGLRLSYTAPGDTWGFSIWGQNLDDKQDYLNFGPGFGYVFLPLDSGALPGTARARPVGTTGRRQVGATVTFNF